MTPQSKRIGRAMKAVIGLIYPPQCLSCGVPTVEDGALCPSCWRECEFISGLTCRGCGVPLPDDGTGFGTVDHEAWCDGCMATPRPWGRAVATLQHRGLARRLVLGLKDGDRPDLAVWMGKWMARDARALIEARTLIVPVPSHPRRLFLRGYNQAVLLADSMARALEIQVLADALVRVRHTPHLEHATLSERQDYLRDAITVSPRRAALIEGRDILLVDDVMTTGTTLGAATKALLDAGAARVDVAVLARALPYATI